MRDIDDPEAQKMFVEFMMNLFNISLMFVMVAGIAFLVSGCDPMRESNQVGQYEVSDRPSSIGMGGEAMMCYTGCLVPEQYQMVSENYQMICNCNAYARRFGTPEEGSPQWCTTLCDSGDPDVRDIGEQECGSCNQYLEDDES